MSVAWKKKKKQSKKPHKRSRTRKPRTTSIWWDYYLPPRDDEVLPEDFYDPMAEYAELEKRRWEQAKQCWDDVLETASLTHERIIQFTGADTAKIYELVKTADANSHYLFYDTDTGESALSVFDENDESHVFPFGENLTVDLVYAGHKDVDQYFADMESAWIPGVTYNPAHKTITFPVKTDGNEFNH